ncbi:MAG: carbamoyltransferase N-terminal domain-containing protein [Hydrogenovibrio sp.]
MKILGTKFYGHDNSVFYLDTEKKEIFAVSNERITRIKHDRASVRKTVEAYPFLKEVDWVISGYEKQDNRKYYSDLYWYDFIYQVCQPKYIKELVAIQKKPFLGLQLFSKLFLSSKEYRRWLWDYFLYKKLKLSFDFNKARSKIDLYYQNLIGVSSTQIDHKDHHLCHAMSAYAFSPFSNEEGILSFTIDGIGDDAFSKLYRFDSLNEYECLATSVSDPIENGRHDGTSIGFIYNDFTSAMDLIPNSDEGKVEALAAYAKADPEFLNYMKEIGFIRRVEYKVGCRDVKTIIQ